jgi:hypothetical protein
MEIEPAAGRRLFSVSRGEPASRLFFLPQSFPRSQGSFLRARMPGDFF